MPVDPSTRSDPRLLVRLLLCSDIHCDTATEVCGISFNDVAAPNEPEYFASCMPLPDGCAQGDCACIVADLTCYAGTGNAVVFYPGG